MKLLNMKLENFQGIKHLELNFNGLNKSIHGDNATGKTTIANAQAWLLTGKSSDNRKNYTPKTENAHGLEHSVECTYSTENGIIILKKVLKEKYTKKRGSTTAEFSGHVVEYYKDGVPVKEKEFNDYLIATFRNLENIQLLSNIFYFAEVMKWDKRRQLLIDMCGDYSDDYIIASNPDLIDLKNILRKDGTADQYHTVDDFMKMTKERMKKTNSEMQSIPARIDEATRAIPNISNLSKEDLEQKLHGNNSRIDLLIKEKITLDSSDDEQKKKDELIRDIQTQIKEARIDHQNEFSNKAGAVQNKINEISSQVNDIQMKISNVKRRIRNAENDLNYMTNRRNQLLDEYKEVQAKEWDTLKEICPTCGRVLPADRVDELKAKFNLDKSKKLEEINKSGQAVSKTAIQEQQSLIDELNKEKDALGADFILKKQKLSELEQSKPKMEPFEGTETYKVLQDKLNNANSMSVSRINAERIANIDKEIHALEDSNQNIQEDISKFSTTDYQNRRIDELKDAQKKLSASYEKMESEIYLCEQFIKAKVNMITENINEKFENVSFKLFDVQINGGLKECCEVMVPTPGGAMVPYSTAANKAATFNAGLEIVDVFQKYLGIEIPIFIDNAESVTELKQIDSQVIRLVVDKNYKELTMMED